ncbi:hypothetical protein, conserved [Plasmodium gonderi]|uniref:Variable surface protein n=1 Tax=Plasmodium gonderi TaxID=77519 RepID=A0A1Y1JK83_PLAGO|nr:hypothetical protein, conserved [Plasmodium gonderi]GAW81825.1 hypothetical protein, conserved [Plasmodium gonderi]
MKFSLLYILCILYLFVILINSSDDLVYEKTKRFVNEADECSQEDINFMDEYTTKLYWIWTNNFFRYLRVKTYIYENDKIYEKIKRQNNNKVDVLKDDFFNYNERDEFIRNALTILSNEKSLKKSINIHSPKKKIKFFQELSERRLIYLLIRERRNLINSWNKFKMFENFRDVLNSKYYYHKKISQNQWEFKADDNVIPDPNEKNDDDKNAQVKNKRVKNVITFNIAEIPLMKDIPFDFYDKNKWNNYFYSFSDDE